MRVYVRRGRGGERDKEKCISHAAKYKDCDRTFHSCLTYSVASLFPKNFSFWFKNRGLVMLHNTFKPHIASNLKQNC